MKGFKLSEIPRSSLYVILAIETLILLGFFVWVIMW